MKNTTIETSTTLTTIMAATSHGVLLCGTGESPPASDASMGAGLGTSAGFSHVLPIFSPQRAEFPENLFSLNLNKLAGTSPSNLLLETFMSSNVGFLKSGMVPLNWLFSRCNSIRLEISVNECGIFPVNWLSESHTFFKDLILWKYS
ncbi:hypothetical protein VIGAN_09191500 [Vigna angularis var. angularis]|uniref:Uncharacterized protein n=1 Tax=Vigna angularis var. angularis TaxID=157739 RepID=A0A0S3SZR1_PHAAN|nr:hypothetical protein VIGAN_09191500 [Vigna angularis var. angularis]